MENYDLFGRDPIPEVILHKIQQRPDMLTTLNLLKSLKDAMDSNNAEVLYLLANRFQQDLHNVQKELYELSSFIGHRLANLKLLQMRDQEE